MAVLQRFEVQHRTLHLLVLQASCSVWHEVVLAQFLVIVFLPSVLVYDFDMHLFRPGEQDASLPFACPQSSHV